MATTGKKYPSSVTELQYDIYDDNAWSNEGNAAADDGSYAQITSPQFDANDYSYCLYATGFDFSAIGDSDTIDGIAVYMERHYENGTVTDAFAMLYDGSSLVGLAPVTDYADWDDYDSENTFGAPDHAWGMTDPTGADVKASGFGVYLACKATGNDADAFVDYIAMEVYYTVGDVSVTPTVIEAVAATVAPTVVKGGVTLTPTEIASVASVEPPTTVKGGVTLTVTEISSVASVEAPSVEIITAPITPTEIEAVASVEPPTTVKGSASISPEFAASVASLVAPTTIKGSIIIDVSDVAAVGAVEPPTVIKGSVTLTPGDVAAIAAVVEPATLKMGVTLTPEAIAAIGAVISPDVTAGAEATTVTPEAAAAIAALGGITIKIEGMPVTVFTERSLGTSSWTERSMVTVTFVGRSLGTTSFTGRTLGTTTFTERSLSTTTWTERDVWIDQR